MALKRLTTAEMVQISTPWTTKNSDARKAIAAEPQLAGLLPILDAAHAGLHAARPAPDDPRLASISTEEKEVDDRHDAVVRGVDLVLEGVAWLVGPGSHADEIQATRALLTPDGLGVVSTSYRNEAGAAALLKSRLPKEATAKAVLQAILVDKKKTLASFVNERFQMGEKLGELEDERAKLGGAAPQADATSNVVARNAWIKAANALVANADLAGLSKSADAAIFSPLREAEKKADRRGKAAPAEPVPGPATPPAATPPPATTTPAGAGPAEPPTG